MPAGGGRVDSMNDFLTKFLGQLGQAMAADDADLPFLQMMQSGISMYMKKRAEGTIGGPPAMQQQQPGPMGTGMQPGAGPSVGAPPGGGNMGLAPNPDELQRILAGANLNA